jgi:hypothetical protein
MQLVVWCCFACHEKQYVVADNYKLIYMCFLSNLDLIRLKLYIYSYVCSYIG